MLKTILEQIFSKPRFAGQVSFRTEKPLKNFSTEARGKTGLRLTFELLVFLQLAGDMNLKK